MDKKIVFGIVGLGAIAVGGAVVGVVKAVKLHKAVKDSGMTTREYLASKAFEKKSRIIEAAS
jgi:hypothetical protein